MLGLFSLLRLTFKNNISSDILYFFRCHDTQKQCFHIEIKIPYNDQLDSMFLSGQVHDSPCFDFIKYIYSAEIC